MEIEQDRFRDVFQCADRERNLIRSGLYHEDGEAYFGDRSAYFSIAMFPDTTRARAATGVSLRSSGWTTGTIKGIET